MDVNGTTVYTTSTGNGVSLVNESSDKSLADKPLLTPAPPAETVNPFNTRSIIS